MLKKVVVKQAGNAPIVYHIQSCNVAYIQVSYSNSDDTKIIALYIQDKEQAIIQLSLSDDALIQKFVDLFNESNSANEIEINLN